MASHCLCSAYQLILRNISGGLSVYMPGPHLGDSDAMALLLSQGSCIMGHRSVSYTPSVTKSLVIKQSAYDIS